MSIFEFLEIIFFRRTEKSGNKMILGVYCIFSAVFETRLVGNIDFFGKPGMEGPFFGHFSYETSHKNYAATKLFDNFEELLLNMVRLFSWSEILSATF